MTASTAEQSTTLFPRGLAQGATFCNRKDERTQLALNIKEGIHTWISGPRRYGKTSLITQTLQDLERVHIKKQRIYGFSVDLLTAYNDEDITQYIGAGIAEIMVKLIPTQKRMLEATKKHFKRLNIGLTLNNEGVATIEFTLGENPQENLLEMLLGLDRIASNEKRRLVVVIDEFQHLLKIRKSEQIEGVIRHAAERAKFVTYVFSGSHRSLLDQMFTSKERPLYKLCSPIFIKRIESLHYHQHILDCAKYRWSKTIDADIIESILETTQCHPYYVNLLCARLWQEKTPPKTIESVETSWETLVMDTQSVLSMQLDAISLQQMGLLKALAMKPTSSPTSKDYVVFSRLSKPTISQALNVLIEKDHIFKDENGCYRVLDPALNTYLAKSA